MTQGIHHITAIASNAQACVDFYTKVLGLRLVKKSVNQDDVSTYHLFFGDRLGHPGLDLTFFIFLPTHQGVSGNGLVTTISFSVPPESLAFWKKRLEDYTVKGIKESERFGKKRLAFTDGDGMNFELVGVSDAGDHDVWDKEIAKEQAIRSFYSATLSVSDVRMIAPILTDVFGYTQTGKEKNMYEFSLKKNGRASTIEVMEDPYGSLGVMGAGTVHHIAFRAKNVEAQMEMRKKVAALGLMPTELINRFYFQSVYFQTLSRILFEIATDEPGFTADEKESELGKHLALPPFLELQRDDIEANLTPIK
jgi:glyoxalase family protein